MAGLVVFFLLATLFEKSYAIFCFGEVCTGSNQYCQIFLDERRASCYTHHGHGHHEEHQMCMGAHHPGSHCFCLDQACADAMARQLATPKPTQPPATQAPTQPPTQGPTQAQTTMGAVVTTQGSGGVSTTMAVLTQSTMIQQTTTTTVPVSVGPTLCQDNESGNFTCVSYNNQFNMCGSLNPTLQKIAKDRCPKFCNICGGNGTAPTQNPLSGPTTLPPCEDHDSRCTQAVYSSILCSASASPDTKAYAVKTCPKSCNYCKEYYASLTAPAKCNVCGDLTSQIPCGQSDIYQNTSVKTCSSEKFCMTDVYQDSKGNTDIFKRCVDENTCRTKWITESADQDYCAKYGFVTNANAFECHFCCHGDGCNTNIMPSASTLVSKN